MPFLHRLKQHNQIAPYLLSFAAIIAEYRQKPLLNLGFIISLSIATTTLLSIMLLNNSSKQQYQSASRQLQLPIAYYIVAKDGARIELKDFQSLKTAGFHQIHAVNRFQVKLRNNKIIKLRAFDLLPLVLTQANHYSASGITLSAGYAKTLGIDEDADFIVLQGQQVKLNVSSETLWPTEAVLDIALAWQLFPKQIGFSHLTVGHLSPFEQTLLQQQLPATLVVQEAWSVEQRQGFADALHLNLSALAVLAFIVSLFIAYQAAEQTWRSRRDLVLQLRQLGISLIQILKLLMLEALILSLLACALGSMLSGLLVNILLPILGLTLEQLYQLRVEQNLQWQSHYLLWAWLISLAAVFVALVKQFLRIYRSDITVNSAQAEEQVNNVRVLKVALFFALLFLLLPEQNWLMLMLKNGCLLLASVMVLPSLLTNILTLVSKAGASFKFNFILLDAGAQVSRRFLPLAAFYLALTSSIAAALMIHSFQTAFNSYLTQLLRADVFLKPLPEQEQGLLTWLKQRNDVLDVVLFQSTTAKYQQDTLTVYRLSTQKQQQSLLLKSGHLVDMRTAKSDCYINEQFAYKHKIALQQQLTLYQFNKPYHCKVQGIYFDFGNQSLAIKVPALEPLTQLNAWHITGYGIFITSSLDAFLQALQQQLGLVEQQIFAAKAIRAQAQSIFKQTFVLTQAIALVLLVVACLGLFLSATALELARKKDLHILVSLGYSRWQLFLHMLIQWGCLFIGVTLLSWPMASYLAYVLVAEVLPSSFGWSMPVDFNLGSFFYSSILGGLLLFPALALPLYKIKLRAAC